MIYSHRNKWLKIDKQEKLHVQNQYLIKQPKAATNAPYDTSSNQIFNLHRRKNSPDYIFLSSKFSYGTSIKRPDRQNSRYVQQVADPVNKQVK